MDGTICPPRNEARSVIDLRIPYQAPTPTKGLVPPPQHDMEPPFEVD